MSVALITALSTGIPAIIGAIIALIQAIRGKNTATAAAGLAMHVNTKVNDHLIKAHDMFSIQPKDADVSGND